jgi:hypothetical protein
MPSSRSAVARRGTAGVVLLVLGAGLWVAYRLLAGTEPLSYAQGAPPETVQLVNGRSYALAIRGGVPAEQQLGIPPKALRCDVSGPRIGVRPLTLTPETVGTKAINQIASFVAPVSGQVRVSCAGLTAVFVDDAANAPGDHAGLALLLATIALTIGAPLALSALRGSKRPRLSRPGDDDEIEGAVDVPVGDAEVRD